MLGCLCGCLAQPRTPPQLQLTAAAAAPLPAIDAAPRVGIEYLAPEVELADLEPSRVWVEPLHDTDDPWRHQRTPPPPRPSERKHTWLMDADDLAAVEDIEARLTLQFLDNLMGEDRRRVYRELGTPILQPQMIDLQSPGIELPTETSQREESEAWLADHGSVLLNRPLRRLLRQTPLVQQLELELDEFKSDHVPLSGPYREVHGDQRNLGRLSMRVRMRPQDPVEIAYMRSGVRVSTGQEKLKLGYSRSLTDRVTLEINTSRTYSDHAWGMRADLIWDLDLDNSLHFVVGDDLDFLSTSSVYSMFDSPMDGSPGLLVYALHLF